MDLNALSKPTSPQEVKKETNSNNAGRSGGFEDTFLDTEAAGQSLDSTTAYSNQSERRAVKSSFSGLNPIEDKQADTVPGANKSTVDGEVLTPNPSDVSVAMADGVLDPNRLTPNNGQIEGHQSFSSTSLDESATTLGFAQGEEEPSRKTNDVARPLGRRVTGFEQALSGQQFAMNTPIASIERSAPSESLGIKLPVSSTASPSHLATIETAGAEGKVKGQSDVNGQLTVPETDARLTREGRDLPKTGGAVRPSHAPTSILERHLSGHAVRMVTESGHPEMTSSEIAARRSSQVGDPLHTHAENKVTQAQSVLAVPRNPNAGLTDLGRSVAMQQLASNQIGKDLGASITTGEVLPETGWDSRPNTTPASIVAPAQFGARPELAASISHQMSEAMRNASDKPIEIALNPAELGRVRMVLSPSDAGVTLIILAERPETLDLMRRNIDDLAKSFADLGYEDISFSFEQNDQMADDSRDNLQDAHDIIAAETDTTILPLTSTSRLAIAPDGVDMRL